MADWPDVYIHTDHDTLEQIDPTKLRRVALLGAAAGYVYAGWMRRALANIAVEAIPEAFGSDSKAAD